MYEQNNARPSPNVWKQYGNLFFHREWFYRGIIIVTNIDLNEVKLTEKELPVSQTRTLNYFLSNDDARKNNPNIHQTKELLNIIIASANPGASNIVLTGSDKIVFTNPKRPEEVFLPLVLHSQKTDKKIGFYIYPWVTAKNELSQIPATFKISTFVTAICLFGANLMARGINGRELPLIQHKIEGNENDTITKVYLEDNQFHPFEETQLLTLVHLASLINALAPENQPKKLTIHLPDYDYILIVIKMYLQNLIQFEPLNSFFKILRDRVTLVKELINLKLKDTNIELEIISPFANLFDPQNPPNSIDDIFKTLNIELPSEKKHPEKTISKKELNRLEKDTVSHIFDLLAKNTFYENHQKIWQDFQKISTQKNMITNFESLFHVANAMIIALATYGKNDYETCSILPSNEKPIIYKYSRYQELLKANNIKNYPSVIALTMLEKLIGYSQFVQQGNAFYFRPNAGELRSLNANIMRTAAHNLGLFASDSNTHPLPRKSAIITKSDSPRQHLIKEIKPFN